MRTVTSLVAVLFLLLSAGLAQAGPSTDHFDSVSGDIETRSLSLFIVGSRSDARRHRALKRATRVLNRDSADLKGDARMAVQLYGALRGVYRPEFSASPFDEGSLADHLSDAVTGLTSDVAERLGLISTAAGLLPDGRSKKRLQRTVTRAEGTLERLSGETSLPRRARLLLKTASLSARAERKLIRAGGALTGGPGRVGGNSTVTVDIAEGGSYAATRVTAAYNSALGILLINSQQVRAGDSDLVVDLTVIAPTTGTFTPFQAGWADPDGEIFGSAAPVITGSVTITELDVESGTIKGTFSVTNMTQIGTQNTRSFTNGQFDLVDVTIAP